MSERFRPYRPAQRELCLRLFDANCPAFFAPNERADYQDFLDSMGAHYRVRLERGAAVAGFGLIGDGDRALRLCWIMVDPARQGRGIGAAMMETAMRAGRRRRAAMLEIAASQHSAPFFAQFGAAERNRVEHGWGPDMHRIDMRLAL